MEVRSDLSQKVSEIFRDFMTVITKLEELGNAAHSYLLGFRQGLSLLQRPPIITSSKLIENIMKKNETKRLSSYIEAGCINIHDATQSTKTLNASLSALSDHLIKAQSLLDELESLTNKAAIAIQPATRTSMLRLQDKDTKSSDDELEQVTTDEDNETVPFTKKMEITEYATLIAVVYSMVKQNYMMQEKIVKALSLKSSSDELETYTLMWSLQPCIEDEIMNRAWKWIR